MVGTSSAATPAMIHTRTRSRWDMESPLRAASPLKHKHGVHHLPKRRRLGVSSLNINRLPPSSDTDSNRDSYPLRSRLFHPSPRATPRVNRRAGAPHRPKPSPLAEGDEMSPRKRKRSDNGSNPSSDSESWVETEDELPDLIAEDDQHLLQLAPASALHRLRKNELIRLWKVSGMWSSDDEGEENGGNHDLSKVQLVNGLIKARKQISNFESPSLQASSAGDTAWTPKESSTSSLTSPPSSSGESQLIKEMEVDTTPKAPLRTKNRRRVRENAPEGCTVNRKERKHKAAVRPRGVGRRDVRKARFDNMVKSPEQKPKRLGRTRSSTVSSQYATTSEGSNPSSREAAAPAISKLRTPLLRGKSSASSIERDTPIIRRLRPRTRSIARSGDSTEVDADKEDNGDDDFPSPASSSRRKSGSLSARETRDRRAKREALRVIQAGDTSSDDNVGAGDSVSDDMDIDSSGPSAAELRKSSLRNRSGSRSGTTTATRSRKHSASSSTVLGDPIELDSPEANDLEDTNGSRTTRSGKAFGDIQERSESSNDMDDDSMDEDDSDELGEWSADDGLEGVTLAGLMRLRRDQLVLLCEHRGLEVGGTKPQLANAIIAWRDERLETTSTTSSQGTVRPPSPVLLSAVVTHHHREGEATPVLQRKHLHAQDPATPARSEEDKTRTPDNDLNLDLQELGLEDFTVKPEFLQKLDKIGSGGFKDVYVGKLRGRKVAISEFREHLSEMDIRELKLLAEFRHPNIVRFRGICIPDDTSQVPCMLISELCENGDLFDYIRNVPPPPLKRLLRLMLDIARGLEYLHLRKPAVIHRDCKSTNILITRSGVAKVGDFGLARVKNSTRSMIRSLVGTVNWQAPELWHPNPKYDYKVDVFSIALVYWEMLSGWLGDPSQAKYPWEGNNEHYIYDAVGQKHKRPPLTGLRKHWGTEPVNLIERMWHQDPSERPTMSDVVADLEALIADCK